MSASKRNIFEAEITKGYCIKILIDVLSGPLARGFLELKHDGIHLRNTNDSSTILFDVSLARENFKFYQLENEMIISINPKHMQRQLKNVKKKDSVLLFIREGMEKLGITIRPEVIDTSRKSNRFETNFIAYQDESNDYVPIDDLPKGGYEYPMVILSTDFQKIKRLVSDTKMGKIITVEIQGNSYLCFSCDADNIYSSELGFGEYNEANGPLYNSQFRNDVFSLLVKLPGLCTQMQFYAPSAAHYPLRIKTQVGTLGYFEIYIKDMKQAEYEETRKKQEEEQDVVVRKPKKKVRKPKLRKQP